MKTKGLVAVACVVWCASLTAKYVHGDETSNPSLSTIAPISFDGEPLDQGWNSALRKEVYHWSQGTRLIPLEWLLALKQKGSTVPFLDDANIRKYGFIPDPPHVDHNPFGLPVGFAVSKLYDPNPNPNPNPNPAPNEPKKIPIMMVEWTCAACHTGQIIAKGKKIQIDGAPSMQNNLRFLWAMDYALEETLADQSKFDAFAKSVFGMKGIANPTAAQIINLRAAVGGLEKRLAQVQPDGGTGRQRAIKECGDPVKHAKYENKEWDVYPKQSWGYGRGDAVGRPSNGFFFNSQKFGHPCNLDSADTPVSIPKVWWAWKHDWVQWNAFVKNPLGRNLAQVLAIGADPETNPEFQLIKSLDWLEQKIEALQPPRWEQVFGPVDMKLAAQGKALYFNGRANRRVAGGLCAHCHDPKRGINPDDKREEWQVARIPVSEIGTDDGTLISFLDRRKKSPKEGEGDFLPAPWLRKFTSGLMVTRFQTENVLETDQKRMQRYRPNDWPTDREYKAPPHEGIWATAPYLHNGSIPNLYLLLSPQEERNKQAKTFCLGHDLTYDPVNVGYVLTQKCDEIYQFDTTLTGNKNIGHVFTGTGGECEKSEGGPAQNGVLGCALSHGERMAIIEYLKTIPEPEKQSP